ncbi:hypothetical protein [Mycolicibacterium iranicum]|uniref:Uncharacterized protein n=1 Tax=Mycolicibacterium iranicum TaxID=912594 RepID=A0A178LPX0_MYCIR|nr:hypothetical protein [Mycolicibacterium iranicum]OAN32625.1 hypothetical protein A4X20_08950 [Mycolicibacterium iranicum]
MSRVAPPWTEEDAAGIDSRGHPDPGPLPFRRATDGAAIAVAWYRTICTLCNGLDLPTEGWVRSWPVSA